MASRAMAFLSRLGSEGRNRWMFSVMCYQLARQIRLMRRQRGWTQQELANRSGLQVMSINRIEKRTGLGIRTCSLNTLKALAAGFDCGFIARYCSWGDFITYATKPTALPYSFEKETRCQK